MHGADDAPAVSQRRFGDCAGNAKVGNLRVPVFRHQNVMRLNVAMDNVIGVRVRQTAGNVFGNQSRRQQVKRSLVEHFFLESIALNVFHNDIMIIARNAYVINADNVGVRKPRRRFRLAMKSLDKLHVGAIFRMKNFYRNGTGKKSVVSFVNFRHAAAADFFFQLVTPAQDFLNHLTTSPL